MSFRIEKKLFIKKENYFDFKKYLFDKGISQLYEPRKVNSLYFDNKQLGMYYDSIEGLLPRKKIRIRNYPDDNQNNNFPHRRILHIWLPPFQNHRNDLLFYIFFFLKK